MVNTRAIDHETAEGQGVFFQDRFGEKDAYKYSQYSKTPL